MAHRNNRRYNKRQTSAATSRAPGLRAMAVPAEKKAPVVYDKPFVLLEDVQKSVFIIESGQMIVHAKKIAEYRQDSRVKELPQKINGLTRYEIQCPRPESGGAS